MPDLFSEIIKFLSKNSEGAWVLLIGSLALLLFPSSIMPEWIAVFIDTTKAVLFLIFYFAFWYLVVVYVKKGWVSWKDRQKNKKELDELEALFLETPKRKRKLLLDLFRFKKQIVGFPKDDLQAYRLAELGFLKPSTNSDVLEFDILKNYYQLGENAVKLFKARKYS